MNKKFLLAVSLTSLLVIAACSSQKSNENTEQSSEPTNNTSATLMPSISVPDATDISEPTNTGAFSLTTSNGNFTQSGNIYTITKAGTYSASGVLNGQIIISAGDSDEVTLSLEGATVTYDQDSPIKCLTADTFNVTVKENTENLVKDLTFFTKTPCM